MDLRLEAPQIVFLAFVFMGIGIEMSRHGQPKKGTYNFVAALIAYLIQLLIMYWGGFFSP